MCHVKVAMTFLCSAMLCSIGARGEDTRWYERYERSCWLFSACPTQFFTRLRSLCPSSQSTMHHILMHGTSSMHQGEWPETVFRTGRWTSSPSLLLLPPSTNRVLATLAVAGQCGPGSCYSVGPACSCPKQGDVDSFCGECTSYREWKLDGIHWSQSCRWHDSLDVLARAAANVPAGGLKTMLSCSLKEVLNTSCCC